MKFSSWLNIAANFINIVIFFYFIIVLFKIQALDVLGLSISGFGVLTSLIANIAGALE